MSENVSNIPTDIKLYFDEISERLWSGHAAVMVGAGFSKNAKKSNPTIKSFPDWAQLGNIFYEKIYGKQPSEDQHYLNVLKLADEVQAAFGRPVLDQIIRSQIPDKEYEPSRLHIKLLELPWTDIFTTNYDTLLERSCDSVTSQRFDIVVCKEDLVYSEKPRIIKLHGSFPSERPFIITENDYRRYPKDYAPFVNTVQQSLLENTLCLIGFSGEDPNFLQWIGWIQDNLGKENSPKIYLIGLFNLTNAQIKLLEQRNIVLIDLFVCSAVSGSHEQALKIFIDYLFKTKKNEKSLTWPEEQQPYRYHFNDDPVKLIETALQEWKSTRINYPNWAVLPEDRRSSLWQYTRESSSLLYHLEKVMVGYDICFLYEFNWRIEKCLCPIYNNIIGIYEKIINRYNPFPEVINIENSTITEQNTDYKNLEWNYIKEIWLELNLSVLRFYREEGLFEKWETINNRLQLLYKFLTPEKLSRLFYERCLFDLFTLDLPKFNNDIKDWPQNISLPLWESKRASLLAETGELEEAEKLLEQSLSFVRKQLNLSPVSNNYDLVSQEANIIRLLQYVNYARSFKEMKYEERKNMHERFSERWTYLKQYKCDPWNEQKLFEIKLESSCENVSDTKQKSTFDIGRITINYGFSNNDNPAFVAYSFLRFFEESGLPFRLHNVTNATKAAKIAVEIISKYSSFWAFSTLIRIGDTKVVDTVFNREIIYRLPKETIDVLITSYIDAIEKAWVDISIGNWFYNDRIGTLYSSLIPEILSRLSVKCSKESVVKIVDFLKKIYSSDQKPKFKNIYDLVKRLLNSMPVELQYEFLPIFIQFPILHNINEIIERDFPEPFYFLSIDAEYVHKKTDCKKIDIDIIRNLVSYAKNDGSGRKRAIFRLGKLYEYNMLDDEAVNIFAEALWSKTDQIYGLPSDTDYYQFYFLLLPHPDNVDPRNLFKKYILNEEIPIQNKKTDGGISMAGGEFSILINIKSITDIYFVNKNSFLLTDEEAKTIFYKLLEWWDSDKHYLKEKREIEVFGSIPDEFHSRFRHLVFILSNILPYLISGDDKDINQQAVLRLLYEFDEYEVPSLKCKAAFLNVVNEDIEELCEEITNAVTSKNHTRIVDALHAIIELTNFEKFYETKPNEFEEMLDVLIQQIKWRIEDGLVSSLNVMATILKEHPTFFGEKLLKNIVIGLHYIINESHPTYNDTRADINERISFRESAARLACILYKYYSDRNEEIPQTIIEWKNICFDDNEFAEVRNSWKDY